MCLIQLNVLLVCQGLLSARCKKKKNEKQKMAFATNWPVV